MLVVIIGGWSEYYFDCGIGGFLEDVFYYMMYGVMYYVGMRVFFLYVMYKVDRVDDELYEVVVQVLWLRL